MDSDGEDLHIPDEDDWLMRQMAGPADPAIDDEDDNSFEDSERFEDDSLCSWQSSESLTMAQNWRGWAGGERRCQQPQIDDQELSPAPGPSNRLSALSGRQSAASSTATLVHPSTSARSRGTSPGSLQDIAAVVCARNLSFDQMEEQYVGLCLRSRDLSQPDHGPRIYPPEPGAIPSIIFEKIIQRCFPSSDADFRLYSCLANRNADEYSRGEALLRSNCVSDVMQIGFHLSGTINGSVVMDEAGRLTVLADRCERSVSARIDRCRVVELECNCDSKTQWCQHVVALCLFRMFRAKEVVYRIPLSDSIASLDWQKLHKLALYLVDKLPRQYLPVAQKLVDELSCHESAINKQIGYPDPTVWPHKQRAIWALNRDALRDNIRRTITKFCVPAPQVHCDVHMLSTTQPAIAAEWASLLRPFRSREPEGLWNLLSIVREMYRRRDENATTLLNIITEECLSNVQILMWWYMSKLTQTGRWLMLGSAKGNTVLSSQQTAQFNCSELCDEIVRLWRCAALNPILTHMERQQLAAYLQASHRAACDRIWRALVVFSQVTVEASAQQAVPGLLLSQLVDDRGTRLRTDSARFNRSFFPGFFEALEACQVGWDEVHMDGVECGDREDTASLDDALSINCEVSGSAEGMASPNMPFLKNRPTVGRACNLSTLTAGSFCMVSPLYQMELVQRAAAQLKKKKKKRRAAARGASLASRQPFLPEFFDPRSLRHAAREAARRAREYEREAVEESTESGQESDVPLAGPRVGAEPAADHPGPSQPSVPVGPSFPQEDVDLLLASAHASVEGLELKFARCEALYTHGYERQAIERALELVETLRAHPPDLCPPSSLIHHLKQTERAKTAPGVSDEQRNWDGKKRRIMVPRGGPSSSTTVGVSDTVPQTSSLNRDGRLIVVSERTVRTFERAVFLAKILSSCPSHQSVLFSFLLFVLEMPRAPMASRYLQVKLYYLESELLSCLRAIELDATKLQIVRERAARLSRTSRTSLVPSVALSHFILDSLSYSHNMFPNGPNSGPSTAKNIGRRPSDDIVALSVALEALGSKQVFAEEDCPMLAESVRRQRGQLSMTLITRCKDSDEILGLVLDKLLDPAVHKMYKRHQSNACYFLEQDPSYRKYCPKGTRPHYPYRPDEIEPILPSTSASSQANTPALVSRSASCQSAESASCEFPSFSETASLDDDTEDVTQGIAAMAVPRVNYAPEGQGPSTSGGSTGSSSPPQSTLSSGRSMSGSACGDLIDNEEPPLALEDLFKKRKTMAALYACGGGRATEAAAHFYTELAKRVLVEAGGTQRPDIFNAPQHLHNQQQQQGTHRKLHVVSFLIGMYALGLNNLVNSTWPTRTYSTHVSWITGQTLEIGVVALEILRETWPSHLIPTEVASIASQASIGRDAATVAQAAQLAVVVLNCADALTENECQKALLQCKEHSTALLELACRAVEQASESGDGVDPEVLFQVAHHWHELHKESEGAAAASGQHSGGGMMGVPSMGVPYMPVTSSYGGQQQFAYMPGYEYENPAVYGYHPSVPPPPIFAIGGPQHHRPHSVYLQAPPVHLYPGNSMHAGMSGGVDGSGAMRGGPQPIHQSHSAPSLLPGTLHQPGPTSTPPHLAGRVYDITTPSASTDPFCRLVAAFRMGMRAMETMGNRVIDDTRNYTKFGRTPKQGDDVKWLLGVAVQLDRVAWSGYVLSFLESASRVIASPYLHLWLTFESMKLFPKYSNFPPIPLSGRPMLSQMQAAYKYSNPFQNQVRHTMLSNGYHSSTAELMESAIEMYYAAVTFKTNHPRLSGNDIDEICHLVRSAHDAMQYIPGLGKQVWHDFVGHVKKQKAFKSDLRNALMPIFAPGQHAAHMSN